MEDAAPDLRSFNAKSVKVEEMRATSEVFKSATTKIDDSAFKSRFASSGTFTSEMLEAGADAIAPPCNGER